MLIGWNELKEELVFMSKKAMDCCKCSHKKVCKYYNDLPEVRAAARKVSEYTAGQIQVVLVCKLFVEQKEAN